MVKKAPVPCTREEMESLIDASIDNDFYFTLFTVAKMTGRRLGEYYNIKVKDLDLSKNLMTTIVLKKRRPATKEAILTPEVSRLLKVYITTNKLKLDDYLFRKVSYRQIQRKIASYAKKAGIKHPVSFHNFRHYFITALVKQNWSYDKIAKLTGHSSVGTLAVYDHAVASDIKKDALMALRSI